MALGDALIGASGITALAVALVLLARAPASRPARLFAYFLVLEGLSAFARWEPSAFAPELTSVGNATSVYLFLPAPFLLAVFAMWYPRPRGRVGQHRLLLPAAVALGVALDIAYLLDHGLWLPPAPRSVWEFGPLYALRLVEPLLPATVAVLFVRDAVRGRAPGHEPSLLMLAAALAINPAYTCARILGYALAGLTGVGPTTVTWPLALVPVALALAILARHAARATGPAKRLATRAGLALAAGIAGGVAVTLLVAAWPGVEPLIRGVPAGVFATASPLLVAYALLRDRLFDIDLKVKRSIREGTVVASFVVVLVVAREGAQALLPGDVATLVGIGATAGLVLALTRVQRFGERVADRALPEVADDPAFLNARKVEVYRAALEEAFARGGELAGQDARLAALRDELGFSERDHALLAFAVRAQRQPWKPTPFEVGGLVLGRYRIERQLGEGANGTTYLALDEKDGGRVALKALRPERGGDPEAVREARAMQAVKHPNVVAMLEVADAGDQMVIVMEYMEGGSLADRLARGPLDPGTFRAIGTDLLRALAAVHAAGAVHRDVKPSNVLLDAHGRGKLADFGIAQAPGFETTVGGPDDLTSAVGTIRFMSPEQARGRRVTVRSDLFSAAATLYEAWTGRPYLAPLPGESAVELQMRAAAGQPFLRAFRGPPALRAWFAKALDPLPERRFRTAEEMLAALERPGLQRQLVG
ncbi:MAG TPA: serine/threonine-protein kinase [Candidatus Thermoplasmatota archaeon]|jgi:hypothetical protein|nr:serine/threonine-protein kinase [Candidatus Thermoplasmatota archaeon]